MKICVLAALFNPYHKGGAEAVTAMLVKGLLADGHEVTVITTKPLSLKRSTTQSTEQPERLTIHRFFPLNIFWFGNIDRYPWLIRLLWHAIDLFQPHSWWRIRSIIRQVRPDLVIASGIKGLGYSSVRAAGVTGAPIVLISHDVQFLRPSGVIRAGRERLTTVARWCYRAYRMIVNWLFTPLQLVVTPSQFLYSFYSAGGLLRQTRALVLRNPVAAQPAAEAHRPPVPPLNFLYVGQITQAKGVPFLIEAFRESAKDIPPGLRPKLHIVGVGPDLDNCKVIADNDPSIVCYGYQTGSAFEAIWNQADVLLVPSLLYENLPGVIIEAQRRGVPVIASAIGGIPELVRSGVNGLLLPAGQFTRWAEVLGECSLKPNFLKTIGNPTALKSAEPQNPQDYAKSLLSAVTTLPVELTLKGYTSRR